MVDGSGAPGQVTFWTGTTTVSGDQSFVWDDAAKRLRLRAGPLSSESPAAIQAQADPTSSLFNEGNQFGQGSNPRVLGIADGAVAAPVNAPLTPTLVAQRVDSSNGPLIPFQFTVRRTAGGGGDLLALHGHVTSETTKAGDVVGVTGFAHAAAGGEPANGFRGAFGVWGAASRTATGTRVTGAEFDVNNSSGVDAADPRLPPCIPPDCDPGYHNLAYGVVIAGLGNAKNTAGLLVSAVAAEARFKTGIHVTNAVAEGGVGVDLVDLAPGTTPLRIRNSAFIQSSANDPAAFPDLRLIGLAGYDNSLRILNDDIIIMPPDELGGQGGRRVLLSPGGAADGPVGVGTALPAADAALEVNGGETRGLRLVPRASDQPPTTPNSVGTLAVTASGVLYIMTPGGWVKVGAQ